MLTLEQIIRQYYNIKDEIHSLHEYTEIVADEYYERRLPISTAAKNGYTVTARQINTLINKLNDEIENTTSGRKDAILYISMLSERENFINWLDHVYYLSPLNHVPETSPF